MISKTVSHCCVKKKKVQNTIYNTLTFMKEKRGTDQYYSYDYTGIDYLWKETKTRNNICF